MTVSAPAAIAFAMSPENWMPPSAITGTPWRAAAWRAVVDRRDLRDADAGDDARRADRAGADADLDRVGARVDERLGRLRRRDVAGDDRDVERALSSRDRVERRRASGRARCRRRARPPPRSTSASARSSPSGPAPTAAADPQPALIVLRRDAGTGCFFGMSLTVMSPLRQPSASTHRELLDLVAVQDRARLLERRADGDGDEALARHQLGDRPRRVVLEAEVAVREDADEASVLVGDRHAGDVVGLHQRERVGDAVAPAGSVTGSTIIPASERLTLSTSAACSCDGEVAVDDADAALARERDRHARLGDRVHRRRDERDLRARSARVRRVRVETSSGQDAPTRPGRGARRRR